MVNVTSFIAGLLFALGLGVSGMMNPQKVRGFLDITRAWDPSLLFVMVGAILIYAPLFRLITKRSKPVCNNSFTLPGAKKVDLRLVIGSAIFGVGWALAGICPGPALASLSTGLSSAFVFVAMMVLGNFGVKVLERLK